MLCKTLFGSETEDAVTWKAFLTAAFALNVMLVSAFAAFDPNRIVVAIDPIAGAFSCHAKSGEAIYTYRTTDRTKFRVSGQRARVRLLWNRGSLADIKVGDLITVQYHLSHGVRIAERVAIYHKSD
jgi:hypothetical protein